VPALWRLLRFRPQVVVLQWWTGAVLHTHLLLAVVARMVGAKVVVEFHEVQDVGELAVPVAGAYVRAVLPLLLRLASGFVIHSEFDRTALRERYPLGDKEVALIPHALYNSYRTDGETADGDHPGCRFLYFGVIRPFKGVEDLVTAFETVAAADPAAELTVVGETWEGWTLPGELIERSSHRDRITFVNRYVSDEDVAGYFAAADVIVLPYHRSSSSGPLHIAMSTGKPVVLTRVGGLVEAAADYEGVVWVTPRDPAALADGMRTASELRGTRFGAAGQVTFADAADRYFDFFARLGVRP
jgi:glycosyltransferase involved in cell wall biosynthesis